MSSIHAKSEADWSTILQWRYPGFGVVSCWVLWWGQRLTDSQPYRGKMRSRCIFQQISQFTLLNIEKIDIARPEAPRGLNVCDYFIVLWIFIFKPCRPRVGCAMQMYGNVNYRHRSKFCQVSFYFWNWLKTENRKPNSQIQIMHLFLDTQKKKLKMPFLKMWSMSCSFVRKRFHKLAVSIANAFIAVFSRNQENQ